MNHYTDDNLWIYKMIVIYLLMVILWNVQKKESFFSNTTKLIKSQLFEMHHQLQRGLIQKNKMFGNYTYYSFFYSFRDKKKVYLPNNHILKKIIRILHMAHPSVFYIILSKDSYSFTKKEYDEIKDAFERQIIFTWSFNLFDVINNKNTSNVNSYLNLYKKIIINSRNKQAGNKCIPIGDEACEFDSECKYINKKYGYRCTVGKDAINAANNNRDNPGHYLHPKIHACTDNESNLKCPEYYDCIPQNNKCITSRTIPTPQIRMKKESSNRLTINPLMEIDKVAECPYDYDVFFDDYLQYCKHKDNEDDICRLDPNGKKEYPMCSTVLCPQNYVFKDGLCINKDDTDDKCSLDTDNKDGYLLCGDYNDYIQINNKDIYDNTIQNINGVNAIQCSAECNKNLQCDSFIMEQNTDNPLCKLKKAPFKTESLIDKENSVIHFKNNINYEQYNNTNSQYNVIKSYDIKSPYKCSIICDRNEDCKGFVIDKNTIMCDLLNNTNNSEANKSKILFKKKHLRGNLCNNNENHNIQQKIKDATNSINTKFNDEINDLNTKLSKDYQKNKKIKVTNAFENMLNNFSKDTIIWDNINTHCKKISIKNLNNKKLSISYIQINGINKKTGEKLNLLNNKDIQINSDDNNILNIINKSFDRYTTPTYFDILLDANYYLTKIIIYNYNNFNNYPIQIQLINKKDFIEKQWKAITNKKRPVITGYSDIDFITDVFDKGNPELFKSYANVTANPEFPSYCRFVKDDEEFCCKHKGSTNEYDMCVLGEKIRTNYPKSYLFNYNKNTNRDNLCWCEGIPPNNNVKCIKTYDNKFSDIYTLASNVNCSNLSGNEIKDLLRKHKKINDLSITSGFYWKRTNGYYLFRNTNFNNKKVILYTIIDADTYKIRSGYPKIVNNLTFPGLTLNKVISSILYAGNDDIYIIYSEIYVKYNLRKNYQYKNYPKKVINNWKFINSNFKNSITNSVYINSEKCILFNNMKLIEYNLQSIENDSSNIKQTSSVIFNINNMFKGLKPILYDCVIYNYNNDTYLFFSKNKYTIYNETSNKILTVDFNKQWKNIWKFTN